ncbi:DUF6157 family protein [Paenibacillus solisilvae]|uniref:DUF6157 family protein n=1 Tax=Paenibacillus solisilvae TaxID=2486751 RepID=A0ABW0VXB9_9BACL
MDWNYYNTLITVSSDCPAQRGMIPPDKKSGRTKPSIEFELIANHPYTYTQEEILYEVHVRHKEIPEDELAMRGVQLKDEFFRKPMPCLRASMLPKKYGWGIHFDADGKMALVPMESPDYQHFLDDGASGGVKLVPAMRNAKKK